MTLYDDLKAFVDAADVPDDYHSPKEFVVRPDATVEATYSLNDPDQDRLTHIAAPPGCGDDNARPVDIERTLTLPDGLAAQIRDAFNEFHGAVPIPEPFNTSHTRLTCNRGDVTAACTAQQTCGAAGFFETLARELASERDDFHAGDVRDATVRLDFDEWKYKFKTTIETERPHEYSQTADTLEEWCEFKSGWPRVDDTAGQLLERDSWEAVARPEPTDAAVEAVEGFLDARVRGLLDVEADVDPRRLEVTPDGATAKVKIRYAVE